MPRQNRIPRIELCGCPQVLGSAGVTFPKYPFRYRLRMISCAYNADATVADRYVYVRIKSGSVTVAYFGHGSAITASVPATVLFGVGLPEVSVAPGVLDIHLSPLPDHLVIEPGWEVQMLAINFGATDVFNQIAMTLEPEIDARFAKEP